MSSSTTIYRYLNEDKIPIYNENRNIRDRLKYNLDEEYKMKIIEKNKKFYKKKKEEFIKETLKEFENYNKNIEEFKLFLNDNYKDNLIKKKLKIIN